MSTEPEAAREAVIRKPRADAIRNRERVLEAATHIFSQGGPTASLETVAREAGVGIGTLYRHFPTRDSLFEAVYRREVEHLVALAERLAAEAAPLDALRQWLRANLTFVATKKGMSAALALAAHTSQKMTPYSLDRLGQALSLLLRRAIAAGDLRPDITGEDLLRVIVGLTYTHEKPGWQETVLRLLDIFLEGLKPPR